MDLTIIFIVVVLHYFFSALFHLKHFFADFIFQNEYMLGKFKDGTQWIKPLLAHVLVHGVITFFILLCFASWLSFLMICFLSFFDMIIHFFMDRIKASPKMLGVFKPLTAETYIAASDKQKLHNKYFWWSLGIDQMIHGMTHELIVVITMLMFILGL